MFVYDILNTPQLNQDDSNNELIRLTTPPCLLWCVSYSYTGGLARDQYGMQHEGLFSRATAGTKRIVEKYHDTVSYALDFICDSQVVRSSSHPLIDIIATTTIL